MIEPKHPELSIGAQCRLLSITRSSVYYEPQGESAMNLDLMLLIDKQFLDTPFYGVQQMTWHLQNEGYPVNVKRVRRLIRLMGLMPIYQKPNTSLPAKGHKTYPYLLRGLRVGRPNQVWCHGYYLFADETRLSVSDCDHGLVHPQGTGLANIQYLRSRVLCRGIQRGGTPLRGAGDHEQRPR